jgi:hypothetical protein
VPVPGQEGLVPRVLDGPVRQSRLSVRASLYSNSEPAIAIPCGSSARSVVWPNAVQTTRAGPAPPSRRRPAAACRAPGPDAGPSPRTQLQEQG